MAYDEGLAEWIRDVLAPVAGVSERKMFGGLAFMVDGYMTDGFHRQADEGIRLCRPGRCGRRRGPHRMDRPLAGVHLHPAAQVNASGRPFRGGALAFDV